MKDEKLFLGTVLLMSIININILYPQQYTIEQTLSDEAQRKTIAFDGLAFLTGELGMDSFLPPGKVADFSGFQYFRDNDPTHMGHNTDFVTIIAFNILHLLNSEQIDQLITLAENQIAMINQYGYNRFPLMKAFRRLLENDIPAGTEGLSLEAVMNYSAELYKLDGEISYYRAQTLGNIIRNMTAEQINSLNDFIALNGIGNWDRTLTNPLEGMNLTREQSVAVMTYASEMYSWYAGSVEADTYFCPERQGTYFGSFYMKDMPAMGNPDFTIPDNLTADMGTDFLNCLTSEQALLITDLVDIQRDSLYAIVDARTAVSEELRKFLVTSDVDINTVLNLAGWYGMLDGFIIYNYAANFSEVGNSLTQTQAEIIMAIREEWNSIPCSGAFLYSEPIAMPDIINTDFLFTGEIPLDSPIPDDAELKKLASGFQFTEGPCWYSTGYLLFSDIDGNIIYKWTPENGTETFLNPSGKSNGICEDLNGNLIVAQHANRQIFKISKTGEQTVLASYFNGKRLNSPNDLTVKSNGSIYFTDPPYGITPAEMELNFSGVYRLIDGKSEPVLLADDLSTPNGIEFSPDETKIYICDTETQRVLVYDVEEDGTLSNQSVLIEMDSNAYPDGLTVDKNGNLFIACSDGGIRVYSPEGILLDQFEIPEKTRNLAFENSDNFILYITAGTSIYCLASPGDQPGVEKKGILPDTGQNDDFTTIFGEDSDYQINTPSYTDNGDGTITDNITGLIWQQEDGGEMTWENAVDYAGNLSLAERNDWRLPKSHELFNLLDHGKNPALNDQYFLPGNAEYWWTSDQQAGNSAQIWAANTGGGIGPKPKNETISAGGQKRYHARCVTGESPISSFLNNNDETVTDLRTGLIWCRQESERMNWEEALEYSENLVYAGSDKWRLPNVKELRSISNDAMSNPSVDLVYFPQANSDLYWSSTSEVKHPDQAWFADFRSGLVSHDVKSTEMFVRSVRDADDTVTYFNDQTETLPNTIQLPQNFPNPFNPTTTISFSIPSTTFIRLVVFDIIGREVEVLINEECQAGRYSVKFNSENLASGIYFYRFTAGSFVETKKMILLK